MMYLKFGFGRATDIACLHVRRNRLSRGDALDIVRMQDGKFPWSYLDKPLSEILKPLGMTVNQFTEICDLFTNEAIFKKNADGGLLKKNCGSLEKINYDNL